MITEIKRLEAKYQAIAKHSEYINVTEILNDLYRLQMEVRLKRIPKNQR